MVLKQGHLLGCTEKLDEILAAAAEPTLRPDIADADSRAATVKQRPTSRRITPAEISVSGQEPGLGCIVHAAGGLGDSAQAAGDLGSRAQIGRAPGT